MLDRQTLDDIIQRVVEIAQPEKIILFGSAARGDMGPNSDVDLLIIKEGVDPLNLIARIYRKLHGVGAAVDAIAVGSHSRLNNLPAGRSGPGGVG